VELIKGHNSDLGRVKREVKEVQLKLDYALSKNKTTIEDPNITEIVRVCKSESFKLKLELKQMQLKLEEAVCKSKAMENENNEWKEWYSIN